MERAVSPEYAAYYAHLQKYRDELQEALKNERDKRQALLGSDMDRLEAVLSLQQAQSMKLRSMETKRLELQTKLGGEGTAADFVASLSDESTRAAFAELVNEMSQLASDIKEQNALALEIARTNLTLLEHIFPTGGFDGSKVTYGPEGERRADRAGHSVELKF